MPLPVSNLFQILAIFSNILFVLQACHSSSGLRRNLCFKLWKMHDGILYKIEISGSVHAYRMVYNSTFFLISVNRDIVCDAHKQGSDIHGIKDDRFIFCEEHLSRVDVCGQIFEQVDNVNNTDLHFITKDSKAMISSVGVSPHRP